MFFSRQLIGFCSIWDCVQRRVRWPKTCMRKLMLWRYSNFKLPRHSGASLLNMKQLRNMRHRNLVKIVMISSSIYNRWGDLKAIVYEFMSDGTLMGGCIQTQMAKQDTSNWICASDHTTWRGLCARLSSLSWSSTCCTLLCLTLSNVLLDADMVAHVGDFGLTRISCWGKNSFLQWSMSSEGLAKTIGYAALG